MVFVLPVKVYSQPKYVMDIPYLEDLPRPSSIEVSIICNPGSVLNVAQFVVLVDDQQYLMAKIMFESLKDLATKSMQVC